MKRRGLLFFISLLFAFAFLLFVPKNNEREIHFHSIWQKGLPRRQVYGIKSEEENRQYFFNNGEMFGYFTENGEVIYSEPVVYGVEASQNHFINYSSVSENLLIKNNTGEILSTIPVAGYPYIHNGRLFLFDIDRCGVSEWDFSGKKIWGKRYASVITCFDCNDRESIVGLINGEILLYNQDGENLYRDQPTGSRIQIIYGLALSESGTYFGVVLGIDPQTVTVFQLKEEGYVPVFSKPCRDTFRREIFLGFAKGEKYLFYEQNEALRRLDIKQKVEKQFPVVGQPLCIAFCDKTFTHCIHSESRSISAIDIYSEGGLHINRFYVSPQTSVTFSDNSLYFQRSGSLHRVDINRMGQ